MGSSVSGIIEELKLRLTEQNINNLNNNFKVWLRYVDVIFCVVPSESDPFLLLEELNQLNNNIKFTIKIKNKNPINFLDVKIAKNLNSLDTTIYRKTY